MSYASTLTYAAQHMTPTVACCVALAAVFVLCGGYACVTGLREFWHWLHVDLLESRAWDEQIKIQHEDDERRKLLSDLATGHRRMS